MTRATKACARLQSDMELTLSNEGSFFCLLLCCAFVRFLLLSVITGPMPSLCDFARVLIRKERVRGEFQILKHRGLFQCLTRRL